MNIDYTRNTSIFSPYFLGGVQQGELKGLGSESDGVVHPTNIV